MFCSTLSPRKDPPIEHKKDVPGTERFLFRTPHDTVLVIGGEEFFGRHDEFTVEAVDVFDDLPGLTNEDVNEIEERYAMIGADSEKLKKQMYHTKMSTYLDFDTLKPFVALLLSEKRCSSQNKFFQDLTDCDEPFRGVLMIMGGDWRQILPIVEGVRGEGVVEHLFKFSSLWSPEYAYMILEIGDGRNYSDPQRQMVHLLEQFIERRMDLINWTFPNVNDINSKTASILTLDNKTSLRLNEMILNNLTEDDVVRPRTRSMRGGFQRGQEQKNRLSRLMDRWEARRIQEDQKK